MIERQLRQQTLDRLDAYPAVDLAISSEGDELSSENHSPHVGLGRRKTEATGAVPATRCGGALTEQYYSAELMGANRKQLLA